MLSEVHLKEDELGAMFLFQERKRTTSYWWLFPKAINNKMLGLIAKNRVNKTEKFDKIVFVLPLTKWSFWKHFVN